MIFKDAKHHGDQLFSFDGVGERRGDNFKLSNFLNMIIDESEYIVCYCERPLLNESSLILKTANSELCLELDDFKCDDFSISFASPANQNREAVINLLQDCYFFYEHPAFIFLNDKGDVLDCCTYCDGNEDWQKITELFKCYFVYKSTEDDVVWYKSST